MHEFDAIYRSQYPKLVSVIERKVGGRALAEEIVQESFLRSLPMFLAGRVRNPDALLRRIAGRLAIDHFRRQQTVRKNLAAHGDEEGASAAGHVTAASEVERRFADRERIAHVLAVLEELSPNVRAAFLLQRFHGLTQKEIAQRLGLAQSTVEKHLARAWRHVVTRMAENR